MKSKLLIALVGVSAAGCQTLDDLKNIGATKEPVAEASATLSEPPKPVTLEGGERTLSPLQNAAIPEKACGMVLWTLDSQRPVPIFRFVTEEGGRVNIGQRPVPLQRLSFDGSSDYGVFESQTFTNGENISVTVTIRFGLEFEGGAYLERGVVKVEDGDGWSIIAPAAGIAGCRQ